MASHATAARRGFSFDPASTLSWSVPSLLLAPFLTFMLVLSGIRGRRATSNVAGFGVLVMLALLGLVTWARWNKSAPLVTTYQWINIPVSFTGAQAFQGFGIDISLRLDHIALAALGALAVMTFGVIVWHRGASRQEAGPARIHALLALGLLGAAGVVVTGDLAAMVAWWGLTGVATYLLLAHRWGTEAAGRISRLGLVLPFFGDLSLLCGVAVLYSRYGQLDVDKLTFTVLRGTYGTGLKGLGLAALLIGLGAVVRGGLFPFTGWLTGTLEAPPAAVAWIQGAWSLLSVVLLARVLPLYVAAGPQPFRVLAYACGLGAIAGALLSLADNRLRRSLVWAGSGALGLVMLGIGQPHALAPAIGGALALTVARPAVMLASGAIETAMQATDLAHIGEAWRRMRYSALALAGGSLAVALAGAPKAAVRADWQSAWFAALALFLLGLAFLQPYAAVAYLELPRRRAFEPTRVREVAPPAAWAGLCLAAVGLLAVLAACIKPWLSFLAGHTENQVAVTTLLLWLGFAAAGAVVAAAAVLSSRRALIELAGRAQAALASVTAFGAFAGDRYLRRAGLRFLDSVEDRVIEAGEGALGRTVRSAAVFEDRRRALGGAVLAGVVGALVVIAVASGLLGPGVLR